MTGPDFKIIEHELESVAMSIASKIKVLSPIAAQDSFSTWGAVSQLDGSDLRQFLGEVAHKKKWFKEQRIGREVSPLIWETMLANEDSDLTRTLRKVQTGQQQHLYLGWARYFVAC